MSQKVSSLKPRIIPRREHTVSRRDIDPEALKILHRLNKNGFESYLVGGCVRDLLLQQHPKDFDIATSATPEEVKSLFRNCRIIGRRFKLAHIHFGRHIIEVATFRGHHAESSDAAVHDTGLILRDNVYGTIEEDACRRDFTINAFYYDVRNFSVLDFTDGFKDLTKQQLRMIGDPVVRYQEDPVRMLRAIRFAAKLNIKIAKNTADPIKEMAVTLQQVSPARLFDEVIKLFHFGYAEKVYELLKKHKLFEELFPLIAKRLSKADGKKIDKLLKIAFSETDHRIAIDKSVSCAFLFGFLLWPVVEEEFNERLQNDTASFAMYEAARAILREQQKHIALPKRFSVDIIEIWQLQWRFARRQPRSVERIMMSHRFRAGFDLLVLRAKINPELQELADWWSIFQTASEEKQAAMLEAIPKKNNT